MEAVKATVNGFSKASQTTSEPASQPRALTRSHAPHRRCPQAAGCRRGGREKRCLWCSCSWVLPRRSRGDTQLKARADSGLADPSGPIDSSVAGAAAAVVPVGDPPSSRCWLSARATDVA